MAEKEKVSVAQRAGGGAVESGSQHCEGDNNDTCLAWSPQSPHKHGFHRNTINYDRSHKS